MEALQLSSEFMQSTTTDVPQKAANAERLVLTREAADFLGFAEKTLEKDRCTRELGIPYIKLGRAVRYRLTDLHRFVEERRVA